MKVTTVSKVEIGQPWRITLSNRTQKTWDDKLLKHHFEVQRPKFTEKAILDISKLFLSNYYIILSYESEDRSNLADIIYIKDGAKRTDTLKVKKLEDYFRNENVVFLVPIPKNFKIALSRNAYYAFVEDGDIIYSTWKEEDCFIYYLKHYLYPKLDILPVIPLSITTTTPETTITPTKKIVGTRRFSGVSIPDIDISTETTTNDLTEDIPLPNPTETISSAETPIYGQRELLHEIGVLTKEELILLENREKVYKYMEEHHGRILKGVLPRK